MEFVQFADLKPTWDIVKFDEGIEDIPCISKNGYRKQNPLDKNIALLFEPERRVNVYYLPKTGEVIVTERNLYGETELTEAFGTKVSDYYKAKEKQRAVRSFLYEMVIGEYLVYRCFEMTAECKKHNENEYSCTISSVSEKKRYVFHNGGVFIENRDYTRIVTTVDRISYDEVYDTLIYEGRIQDGEKSLSELLGITGAQIKFLKNIRIPENLEMFAECMDADDFKEHFSDVKKRIFAVSFYLNGISLRNNTGDLTREEVFSAAQTLNSLEKSNDDKRDRLLSEYRDYLRMHRTYHTYVANMHDDDPLRQEIIDFGEVPINIKPSKIRDYHNKLGRIVDIMNCSDQITKYTAAIEERHEKEARKVEYTNGKYSICMPKNAREIIREGRELQHCVGRAGYIQSMAAGKCMILFLRESKDLDIPRITIEVRDGKIRQCYGFRDSYNDNPQIREFVKEYAALQNLTIDAIIYSPETERVR